MPPLIKVYEALGAIGDNRVHITAEGATVTSSSGDKTYTVLYDKEKKALMANDNGSYWQGYLGYPAISYLLIIGEVPFNTMLTEALKGIPWKQMNNFFKNDYGKTIEWVHQKIQEKGNDSDELKVEVKNILTHLETLQLSRLGKRLSPPRNE